MRCAVTLSNLTNRAPKVYPTCSQYYDYILNVGGGFFAAGTYTVTADLQPEEGKTITCYVAVYDDGDFYNRVIIPTTGEAELPFTFTLSAVKRVQVFFGYEGFRSAAYGEGEDIATSAVTNVKVAEVGKPEADIYETVGISPEEIADSDVMAQALNSKTSCSLRVLPSFESWGFAVRGLSIVRIYDLDLPSDRCIFKGRVSAISDIMDTNGAIAQELTCVSAADFLEDSAFSDNIAEQNLSTWISTLFAQHNGNMDTARKLTPSVSGSAVVSSGSDYICKSNYGIFNEVMSEKYLRENNAKAKYEWRERYQNDTVYIDIAAKIGSDKDTAIVIGENLKNIKVDRMTDGGIYTAVCAVSAVNADGYRYSLTVANDEMYTKYGGGRELVIVNDNIYFVGKGGRDYQPSGGYSWYNTPATEAMIAALRAWAEQEAAKLSDPPITITLAAADLAAMGYTGYERFEIGNSYPVVCPPVGLYGQMLRVTGIKRRLSDGRIEQITIAKGETAGNAKSGTLSTQLSRLVYANAAATTDDDSKLVTITDQKIETQTDGVKTLRITRNGYGSIYHDPDTLYIIDDDGEKSMALGDDPIVKEGGGGVIETAAILSSEQMIYWAPDHELVPVDFRGGAHVYYSQPPAKIVIQKQHAIVSFGGSAPSIGMVSYDDLYEEIVFDFVQNGVTVRQKISIMAGAMQRAMVSGVDTYIINPLIMVGEISGGTETPVGYYQNLQAINIPASADQWSFGLIVSVNELMSANNQPVNPKCTIYAVLKIGTEYTNILGVPSGISGSLFNPPFTAEFLNDAERNFALGVAGIIEPAEELSNGGDGE